MVLVRARKPPEKGAIIEGCRAREEVRDEAQDEAPEARDEGSEARDEGPEARDEGSV